MVFTVVFKYSPTPGTLIVLWERSCSMPPLTISRHAGGRKPDDSGDERRKVQTQETAEIDQEKAWISRGVPDNINVSGNGAAANAIGTTRDTYDYFQERLRRELTAQEAGLVLSSHCQQHEGMELSR